METIEKEIKKDVEYVGKEIKINSGKLITILIVVALVLGGYNQFQLMSIKHGGNLATGITGVSASVMPAGIPDIYGKDLGISYNDVGASNPQLADQTIRVMSDLDRTLTLTGDDLQRYIDSVSQISCEYCCGAKSIIFDDGQPACGCAHSYAMRGLAKYLILNHGSEFSNEDVLEELSKWKTLFFPGQMQAKAQVMKEKGIDFSYTNLGSNKYRGIEKGALAGGGMVGGC
jgi:hypothetical protein